MDGTFSPLKEIVEVLNGRAGYIIVDEAYSTYMIPKAGASSLCLDWIIEFLPGYLSQGTRGALEQVSPFQNTSIIVAHHI